MRTHLRKKIESPIVASLAVVLIGVLADRLIADGGGGGTTAQCHFTLWNNTTLDVTCSPTSSCKTDAEINPYEDIYGYSCDAAHISMTCRRLCNMSGQVVSGDCVCYCLNDPAPLTEPNCPHPQ